MNLTPHSQRHLLKRLSALTATAVGAAFLVAPGIAAAQDSTDPDLIAISPVFGTNYIGETATIEVSLTDAEFPDGAYPLTVSFDKADPDPAQLKQITEGSTVTFDITLDQASTWVVVRVADRAGDQVDWGSFYVEATHSRNDYNRDGFQDLMAVRKSDGNLMFYAGNGDGTFDTAVSLGSGWGKMDIAMAGDLTGDGIPDLAARNNQTGTLYTYPGNGAGSLRFGSRISVGTGWNGMVSFTAAGDFDEDGKTDLMALRAADRRIYFYPGRGDGTFGSRSAVISKWADRWASNDAIATFGDLNRDGHDDLLARESYNYGYVVYLGDGNGGFSEDYETLSANLQDGADHDLRFDQVTAAGDLDGDGYWDLLALNAETRRLELRSFDEQARGLQALKVIGSGWNRMVLPTVAYDRTYDFSNDVRPEVVARNASDNGLYMYYIGGTGKLDSVSDSALAGAGWNLIETAGDLDSDGFNDIVVRHASTGTLYVYPGYGDFGLLPRITVGTGWNSMSAVVSGQDYNGDGEVDLLARQKSTGDLYFYPGKGNGTFGSRVRIGTGWNSMRELTAVGDLDHDGHADLIAVKNSDGCLYFYGGRGNGTLKSRVKISCGWAGYDAFAAVGDYNGDNQVDFIVRRKSDGNLFLYKGNGAGGYTSRTQIGTAWNSMTIA